LNELAIHNDQLPVSIDELAKFAVIGAEKLKALKAEIRAIDKLNLAKEVYDQKLEEQQILSGLVMDVFVKIGEFTATIPKSPGGRPAENSSSRNEEFIQPKTKKQAITKLGFSKDQVSQFEILAKNKDLVEQEKAQAAEEDRPASRAKVLELAKQRQKHEEKVTNKEEDFNTYIDHCHKLANFYNKVLYDAAILPSDDEHLNEWMEIASQPDRIEEYIGLIEEAIPRLLKIKNYLQRRLKNEKS
jgi:hypothetical protein